MKCPKCHKELTEIIYGLPGNALFEAERRGEVLLGGCVLYEGRPQWYCKRCKSYYSCDKETGKLIPISISKTSDSD